MVLMTLALVESKRTIINNNNNNNNKNVDIKHELQHAGSSDTVEKTCSLLSLPFLLRRRIKLLIQSDHGRLPMRNSSSFGVAITRATISRSSFLCLRFTLQRMRNVRRQTRAFASGDGSRARGRGVAVVVVAAAVDGSRLQR